MKQSSVGVIISSFYVAMTFVVVSVALTSFAFADVSKSRRTETLTRVLAALQTRVPAQANSPEAITAALANAVGNTSEGQGNSSGGNGGAQGGNGGNGGNSSPGGLVQAGSVVSNATAINAINTVILRISFR